MSSDLSKFYSSVQAIKTELEFISNCGQSGHVFNAAIFQKFLYYSIDYISGHVTTVGDGPQSLQLHEWFSLLSDVIHQLFQRRPEWDHQQSLSPKNLISYLSNISFKLMGLKEAPLDWQRQVWFALLGTMLLYSHHPSTGPEFISSVAQQGYKILLTAVKKAKEVQPDSHTNLHLYCQIYLLGAAITNLDMTGKSGNPLKLAKDFLYNYLSSCKSKINNTTRKVSSTDKGGLQHSVVKIVDMAVVVYGLQPRDVAADLSLSFYTELFRVAVENDALCAKLLACGGNMFRFALTEVADGLPAEGVCAAIECNGAASADTDKPSKVESIVLSVLTFVHEIKKISKEPDASNNLNNIKKMSRPTKSAKKLETFEGSSIRLSMKDITSATDDIQALLKESPGPVSIAISDSLGVLVYSVPRSKDTPSEILIASIKLISLAVDAFSRDIFQCALKQGQVDLMNQRLHALGVAAMTVMLLLDNLLGRDQLDAAKIKELADMLKSTLQALHCLVEVASSKKVSCHELLNKNVFPVLKKAMSDIGIVGRKLTQQGLHSVAISFLSPLWPVTRMKELLPSISHHVSLCESYLKTSQLKEAWSIISKAVTIDASLVSEPVVKILVKVLKQEPSLSVLKLFESCQDEDKGLQLMVVVASRLSQTQSMPAMKQASNILRFLANHKGLSDTDRATQRFYLAQTLWFEAEEKTLVSEECLELLKKATCVLLADTSQQFDDILAQSAFLYWGMLNTLSHLAIDDGAAEVTAGIDASVPPSAQESSPHNSSSLRDASEMDVMMQQSSLGFDFTPKRVTAWSKRAGALGDRSACQVDSKAAEQVDSEFLMVKATSCLKVWTAWFTSVGHKIAEEDVVFRMDTSLRFLQKIAELASINYKTTVAVTALCQAHHLAALIKRPDVMRDVMQTLIVLIPQLRLQCAPAKDSSDVESHGFLLGVPDFEQSGNLASLTAVAAHHLKTGQLEKYVLARNLAAKMIEDSRRKGLRTCSIYTAQAVINRLDAEFYSLPASAGVPDSGSYSGSMTHPLELAGESLKNIKTVVTFNLGEDFQSSGSKKPSLEFWRVIHEYLLSVKQYGNLCLHTGNAKYAKTYFTEGLTMARKCLLVTWCAIFSVCLLKLSLLYHDTTTEADGLLQSAVTMLKRHKLAVSKMEVKYTCRKTAASILTSRDLSRLFDTSAVVSDAVVDSDCPCSCEDSDSDLRSQLLANRAEILDTSEETMEDSFDIVTYASTCSSCFQPEIAQLCADLMSSQAEIVWRNKNAVSSVASTIQSVAGCIRPLMSISHQEHAGSVLTDNIDIQLLPVEVNTDCLPAVNAVYKLAEVKWQALCSHDGDEIDNIEGVREIENLLDVVEREGKKMKGGDSSNVLVASALLLRSHLVYQPVLQVKVADEEDDVVYDGSVIEVAVGAAKNEKLQWDEKRRLWLHLPDDHESHTGSSLASEINTNKKSGHTTDVSSLCLDIDLLNSSSDLKGGKINKLFKGNVEYSKTVSSENEESSNVGGQTKLVCSDSSDKTKQCSHQSGNNSTVCIQDDNKMKVLSKRNGNKAEELSSQGSKKYKSTYSIYSDVETASAKKPRVVLSEKQNVYSVDNIGVESPCLKDSVLKGHNSTDKLMGERGRSSKSRKVPQVQQLSGAESQMKTGLCKIPRTSRLSHQEKEVVSKKSRNENGRKAEMKNVRDDSEMQDAVESICVVPEKNGKHLRGKKKIIGKQTLGRVCDDRLKINQAECGSRHDVCEGQDLALTVKLASGEADSEEDWKNLIEKSKENSRTKTARKGRQPGLKNGKKEDQKDDVATPVKDIKTRRTRRIVRSAAESPEGIRDFMENVPDKPESRFNKETNASGFRKSWGCIDEDDAEEPGMGEDEEIDVGQHENDTDVLLSHSLFPPLVEIEIPDSVYFQENDPFLVTENGHISFSFPVEIPRGRPQRRRPETEVPEISVSQSGRTVRGRGRERAVKKSSTTVNHPQLEVSIDIDEKENILLETDDSVKSLPVVRNVQYDKGSQLFNGKTVNVLQSSTLLPSASSNSKIQKLQETLSPNIASQPGTLKSRRHKVAEKDTGKQTVKGRKTVGSDLCPGEEMATKMAERMTHVRDSETKACDELELQELVRKFPSLAYSQSVTTRIKCLREALAQLDKFPHSVLYRQICRTLAMCLWEQDMTLVRPKSLCSGQCEIAAYLTESMHITFQHLLAKNLHYKLRKSYKPTGDNSSNCGSQFNEEEVSVEREAMQTSLNTLTFGGNVMTRFTDRLKSLPDAWTIGQISIADFDPTNPGLGQVFVTRLTSHLEPLTVGIPFERCQFLERALRVYEEAVVYKVENLTPEQHWKHRHQQDQNMQNLIYYLQELFLGGHKWLLRGQLTWVRDPSVQKLLDETAQDTVALVQQLHGCHICCSTIRCFLEVLLQANEKEVASLVECVWPPQVVATVVQACMNVQRSLVGVCQTSVGQTREPLVLILDNKLIKLPWESMPDLFLDTVTRIPSLATLGVMVTVHKNQTQSPFHRGVDSDSVVAVIPPDTDLQNAVSCLAPQFRQYKGWTCQIQKAPTISELKTFLTDNSLYIYCGHNWGHQYVGGRDVQLIRGKAVAILMGCSSAKLDYRRKLDGDGGPLYFILAGCPAVMGNLWLVTDKDIDKLTSHLFSQWMSQDKPTSLGQLLVLARKACRLHGLTGFAPVVYGLPVMMN